MGHELSGEVVEAPAGSALQIGEPVYVMPYMSCGECRACKQGKTNCCLRLQVLGVHRDGALTEYMSIPSKFAVTAGQRVLVVGAGPIGLAAMLFARLRGAEVVALDTRADRLAFCRSALNIQHTVEAGEGDRDRLAALTENEFFDVVFDATGNAGAMERGFELVGHGGSYVLISIVRETIAFSDPEFHKRETTLLASRNATAEDFSHVLDAMKAGQVPTGLLNTHRATLDTLPALFRDWLVPGAGVIKAIVEC
jgi:2-desacetyl-2-hydroxyethyl bacteriochlorophyllide A dehydrogenase